MRCHYQYYCYVFEALLGLRSQQKRDRPPADYRSLQQQVQGKAAEVVRTLDASTLPSSRGRPANPSPPQQTTHYIP